MRVLYPDLVFGAISSSGVVHATIDDWYYYDIIRQYAPTPGSACMARVAEAIEEVDALIEQNSTHDAIKVVFGLQNLTYDPDFASLLSVRSCAFFRGAGSAGRCEGKACCGQPDGA